MSSISTNRMLGRCASGAGAVGAGAGAGAGVDRANAADAAMPMIAASIVVDAQRAALPCRAILSLPFSLRNERRSRGRAAIGRVPIVRARPFGLVFPVLRAGRPVAFLADCPHLPFGLQPVLLAPHHSLADSAFLFVG